MSLSCGVDALLRAAQFLEEQETTTDTHQLYRPIALETPQLATEETKPGLESPTPSLVVISRPAVNLTSQPVTIDLSKNSSVPLSSNNGSSNNVTIYNIDESQTSLNLSAESSGYVSSTTSSLNHSAPNGDDLELEKSILQERMCTPIQSTFSALPPSASNGRRRTISSNSNSSTLRSPSTVRAGTREVHNKLEKNRRAHLKECFEALKKQLPITPDEKKTSNLSILGAAIRHIQFLKRKEREFEHEMERLAKEKIAAQNRILLLKRELAQWDIDFTKLLPEQTDITAVKSERTDSLNEVSGKGSVLYSSTSSLSSITTTASPVCTSNLAPSTNLPPNIIPIPSSSPPRIAMMNAGSSLVPLSLSSKSNHDDIISKVSINPLKLTASLSAKTSMMIATPTTNGIHNQIPAALNLKAAEVPSSCQTMPLNLQAAISSTASLQPQINGLKNGLKGYNQESKSTSSIITNMSSVPTCIAPAQVTTVNSGMKMDPNEPPTKLIKLINGSAILSPMDKDNKMLHSGQLTLQQVVGGGGLVVSPIQLVASSQGFKVIGQPNGVTTIELSTPHINGHPTNAPQHRSHQLASHTQPGNLQKLLMNGNGINSSSSASISTISIPAIAQQGSNGNRLAPGGAELNLLPSHTTANGAIYRNQGKLAIVKETNNSNRVHVMQSAPTIVVSQPQNINIMASSPQFAGKMMQSTGSQYLNAKPMLMMNHNGNGSPSSASIDVGKNHN